MRTNHVTVPNFQNWLVSLDRTRRTLSPQVFEIHQNIFQFQLTWKIVQILILCFQPRGALLANIEDFVVDLYPYLPRKLAFLSFQGLWWPHYRVWIGSNSARGTVITYDKPRIFTLSMSVIVTALLLLFIERNWSALMHDRISSSVFVANLVRALRSTFTWFNLQTSSSREVNLLLSIPLKYRIRVCSRSSRSAGT